MVPTDPLTWVLGFGGIMLIRLFIEVFLADTGENVVGSLFASESLIRIRLHDALFFLVTLLAIWLCLSFFLRKKAFSFAKLPLVAASLIVLPPLLDMVWTGGSVFWSFYVLMDLAGLARNFVTVFSELPSGIVYFGTKIIIVLSVLLLAGVVFTKTRKVSQAALSAFAVYTIYFLMGSLPSWLAFAYYFAQGRYAIWQVKVYQTIQFIAAPTDIFARRGVNIEAALAENMSLVFFLLLLILLGGLFYQSSRAKFGAFVRNARLPQLIYHAGMLLVGLGLGYLAYPENFTLNVFAGLAVLVLLLSVWLAWEASVIVNDIYDFEIDAVSNPERPLQKGIFDIKDYQQLGLILFILSLLGGLIVGPKFFELLLLYQVLAWFYSGTTFRLKRFPVVATLVSACATLLVLFMGFTLFSGAQNLNGLSGRLIALLLLTLTLSLPIKDFKDILGDQKDGIWTIPVLFGEERGRLIVATNLFVSFMASVFLLNEPKLFVWALLCGALAFLLMLDKKINPRNIFWWILGVVSIYGLFIIKIVFLPIL